MEQSALIYLAIINLLTFLTYKSDKKRAIKKQWRVPEKTLLLLALAGGSPAAWLAMRFFHHKTSKPIFKIGVPCIIILQIGIVLLFTSFGWTNFFTEKSCMQVGFTESHSQLKSQGSRGRHPARR